jgi:hypothetical protein
MTGCSSIRSEIIRDELVWDKAIFLQQLAHQFERRPFVSPGLDQNVEHFTLGLHGTPRMDHPAIDCQIESSGPGELHPQALTDPDVSVSTHPALTVQPVNGFALPKGSFRMAVDLSIKPNSVAPSLQRHYSTFITVGSEEAPIEGLASVRRSNGTCRFPAFRFHEWLHES